MQHTYRYGTTRYSTTFVLLAGLVAISVPATATKEAPKLDIRQWTMNNGLSVVFVPMHRIPAVTVQVWYHVGSKDEKYGMRGVAHMFEHMMFKGSKHVPPEQHAQMLDALGGRVNAFTTEDVTAYHNTLPSPYFEFAVQLEAERMRNLQLTEPTVNSEREVVKEERRMRMENSPVGRAIETIRDLAYVKHPYSWTPVGHFADLNQTTPAVCKHFYNKYYIPNNATLIVVGDVTETRVKDAATRYFATIPRGKTPPRNTIVEPKQQKQRNKAAGWPSQLNIVLGAYHIPAAAHEDMAPLAVLSTVLSAGRTSRLYQQLVRKHSVALGAGGFADELEQPGIFMVYAIGLPTHHINAMKDALLGEIARIAQHEVSKTELDRAKSQLTTGHLRNLERIDGIADQIGMSTYLYGNPKAFLDDVARIDRVTAKDVQRVAQKYLRPDNLSLLLVPSSMAKPVDKKPAAAKPAGTGASNG